jgi:hypothetical protein
MAKRAEGGVNKSELVRNYLKKARRAKPKRVVEEMAKQGIEVTPQFVSQTKSNMRKKKKAKRSANEAATEFFETVSLDTLLQAKRLAAQLGGVAKAKEALDALAKLR